MKNNSLAAQISIVIITRNRRDAICDTLQHIRTNYPDIPIVLVDNHSSDGTPARVSRDFPDIRLIALSRNQAALGRNIGVYNTATPYITFCDDDSWWEADALPKAVNYFEQYPKLGLLTGKILVKKEQKLDPTSALQSVSPLEPWVDTPGRPVLGFLGCAAIIRRDAYLQVGGYNHHIYFSGEEALLGLDLAMARWGIAYCDDLVCHHYPSKIRNMTARYQMGLRNVMITAWLRRPIRRAIIQSLNCLGQAIRHPSRIPGLFYGLASLPYALANRQVIPDWLENRVEVLEKQNRPLRQQAATVQQEFVPTAATLT